MTSTFCQTSGKIRNRAGSPNRKSPAGAGIHTAETCRAPAPSSQSMTPRLRFLLVLLSLPLMAYGAARREYAVVLQAPPAAANFTGGKQNPFSSALEETSLAAQAVASQAAVRQAAEDRGIPVLGASQLLVNCLWVSATPEEAGQLRGLPGVARVEWNPPLKRTLFDALTLVNAPRAWPLTGGQGNAGLGVRIAILDSGLDHTHPGFQDDTLPIPQRQPNLPPESAPYVNRKILVARSYVAQLPFSEIRPEDSRPDDLTPRDRSGHGTAVASIAAGAVQDTPLGRISGIAPKAYLGNYKIFGSPGINDTTTSRVLIHALEDAVRDNMDVAVLSLGAPALYGPLDRDPSCSSSSTSAAVCDLRADAVENAVRMGMTVVVSAGNDGDFGIRFPAMGTINSPGTAPSAITVGATTNGHILFSSVRVAGAGTPASLARINALFGDGTKPQAPVTAPVRDVTQLQDDGRACSPLGRGSLQGAIALVQRGGCSFLIKSSNVQQAGASGIVLIQTNGSNFLFNAGGLSGSGIPFAMIGSTDGGALRDLLRTRQGITVTLDPGWVSVTTRDFDTVADFSSRGPATGTNGVKPELVAVGTDMYTAAQQLDPNGELYDPSRYTGAQGTSFAAPLVAGAAALMEQRFPTRTPAQIKSALVNTASDTVADDNGRARVLAVGAGKLDAAAALQAGASAEPAVLSFGGLSTATQPWTRTFRLTNLNPTAQTFTLTVAARDSSPAARVLLDMSSVRLEAGQSATITARVDGQLPAPGSYEGAIVVRGGASLRIPYWFAVTDGVAFNAIALTGGSFTGALNERGVLLVAKVVDRYGLPVAGVQARFRVVSGGGALDVYDAATDRLGIAGALVNLGPQLGTQQFALDVADMTVDFIGQARLQPAIQAAGVVNAASFQGSGGAAPGSYISILGAGLAEATRAASTSPLPISLAGVSVSFDVPAARLSLPGSLHFVSEKQINVQVPWELRGQNSVLMKVSVGESQSAVYSLALSDYDPAAFEYADPASGRLFAAALDGNYRLVGPGNPARAGDVVQLYANALGPVDRAPGTGEPAPAEPLARTRVTPDVTIGGRSAQVLFSGLAPGLAGLYQLNVLVPGGLAAGPQAVIITANGIASKAAALHVQ